MMAAIEGSGYPSGVAADARRGRQIPGIARASIEGHHGE
jgi:hypothetical protein